MVIQYKILVFAMLFLKDNIITMTPENDSLLAYNASCWASTRSSRTDLSEYDQHVYKLTQPPETLHL